jgi:hypothetical protein
MLRHACRSARAVTCAESACRLCKSIDLHEAGQSVSAVLGRDHDASIAANSVFHHHPTGTIRCAKRSRPHCCRQAGLPRPRINSSGPSSAPLRTAGPTMGSCKSISRVGMRRLRARPRLSWQRPGSGIASCCRSQIFRGSIQPLQRCPLGLQEFLGINAPRCGRDAPFSSCWCVKMHQTPLC